MADTTGTFVDVGAAIAAVVGLAAAYVDDIQEFLAAAAPVASRPPRPPLQAPRRLQLKAQARPWRWSPMYGRRE